MTGLEVCGYVDVKVPSKGRKFGTWKAWRRQWCVVRCGEGDTIQMILGNGHNSPTSCLHIPYNAVLCRSESRSRSFAFGIYCSSNVARFRQPIVFLSGRSETESQQWMARIRNLVSRPKIPVKTGEFSVSLIDNEHSRTAGLAGLHGTLSTSITGITISDPSTGQIKVHWRWSQVEGMSLQQAIIPDDKQHVLVIRTSSEFACGEGELQLFCLEGSELENVLSKFQSKPQHRLISSPLPPLPGTPSHALLASRRLSRSEGDLRCWPADSNFSLFHLRTQSMSRNTNDKVVSSLVTAGLGLLLTTPGCSEPDSLHDYQCLDTLWPEAQDTLTDLPDCRRLQFKSGRRESGVSIASGIYEEIEEQPDEIYESMQQLDPPPLPPRKHEPSVSEEEYSLADESLIYSVAEEKNEEEPLYLPMSPGGQKEDTYVAMANLINQNNHISEPVV